MSPTIVGDSSSHSSSYGHSPLSPNHSSAADSKSTFFSDIFSEDLFDNQGIPFSDQDTSSYTSQRLSGSPDLKAVDFVEADDPETLAKEDPLATQVWKMYARNKAALPHAHRMENLTWRMMALALKKRKDEEEAKAPEQLVSTKEESPLSTGLPPSPPQLSALEEHNNRGRGRDKGKVRVVGFDGINQDGAEDDEYVILNYCVLWHHT
jgi:GATA-binding protein